MQAQSSMPDHELSGSTPASPEASPDGQGEPSLVRGRGRGRPPKNRSVVTSYWDFDAVAAGIIAIPLEFWDRACQAAQSKVDNLNLAPIASKLFSAMLWELTRLRSQGSQDGYDCHGIQHYSRLVGCHEDTVQHSWVEQRKRGCILRRPVAARRKLWQTTFPILVTCYSELSRGAEKSPWGAEKTQMGGRAINFRPPNGGPSGPRSLLLV